MKKLRLITLTFLAVWLVSHSFIGLAVSRQAKPDVRLLIDISGSMKKNDPNNLRIPALQLVTNLMPQGADAGVWAFGRYVNMMVPLAQVDAAWQDKATATATKINSAGLFTNIGEVLEKASYGWTTPSLDEKRSLILLTDGMVDISKNPEINARERKRILEQLLPKLIQADVSLHTIALSQNADHELLKALSNKTDGWYQAVESAEELQKVFLKIFEQSAARDTLPLTDNQFNVDASIEEMTLLVFKSKPGDKTQLVRPDNNILKTTNADGSVRWFSTEGYDLVTVKSPLVGEWRINADIDPDNRVMVVSKLGLDVSEVPNNLLAGEAIDYQVGLLQDGKLIEKADFLNLVKAQLVQSKQSNSSRLAMFYDSTTHRFKQNFFTDSFEGVLNLTLEVKSPTFERTRNHAVNVYGSPLVETVELSTEATQPHRLTFSVREDIVKKETLTVNVTVTHPDGEKRYLVLDDLAKPVEIKTLPLGGEYKIGLDIKGESILGRAFSISPAAITFVATSTIVEPKLPEPKVEAEVEPATQQPEPVVDEEPLQEEPEAEEKTAEEKTIQEKESEEMPSEDSVDSTMWLYLGLIGNLVLFALGFLGWKILKKKKHQNTAMLADELGIEEDDADDI